MRRWIAYLLLTLAALLTVAGGLAGWANRQLLDGPTFVANIDQLRRDPAVTAALGAQVADVAIHARPDLVAIEPLVAQISAAAVGSRAAEPVFRLAASQTHQALTTPSGGAVVLRIADFGAVVTAVLRYVSPQAASVIPPSLPVTLSQAGGSGGVMGAVVEYVGLARTLAWLLPLLAIACFTAGVLVHPRRRRCPRRRNRGHGGGARLVLALAGSSPDRTRIARLPSSLSWCMA
jgi:hypothetical protein